MLDRSKEAFDYYRYLIASDMKAADEQHDMLMHLQNEHNTLFGGRPLSASLTPMILSEGTYQYIQDTVYVIRQAILKISAAFFNNMHTLRELGMTEREIELAAIPTNVIRMSASARLDAFLTHNSFKFVELNAESPAGIAYCHEMAKIYRKLPIFQKFTERYPVRFVSPLEHLVHGFLSVYHEEFDGREDRPAFAIVDHLDIPTYPEFLLIKNYLEGLGMPCEIADPRNLEIKDGFIYANGRKIDILYRRLLMNEFFDIIDDCGNYMEGYRAQKTCFLNSFRTKLVHKKHIFSLLTDSAYMSVLDNAEIKAIRQHIPWTRKLRDRKERYMGREVDLLPMIRKHPERFVIKPNDDYGGHGVVLGFRCTQKEWDDAIDKALKTDFVVQEIVDISKQPFMLKINGNWEDKETIIDLDPYLNGPMMGGCLTRTAFDNLANVTAGGGSLPMFIARYLR